MLEEKAGVEELEVARRLVVAVLLQSFAGTLLFDDGGPVEEPAAVSSLVERGCADCCCDLITTILVIISATMLLSFLPKLLDGKQRFFLLSLCQLLLRLPYHPQLLLLLLFPITLHFRLL